MANVLVTGAGVGIGCAVALQFARRGDRVFAGVRDARRAVPLLSEAARLRLVVHPLALDVCDAVQVAAARASIEEVCSGVDVLVNNAGMRLGGSVEETDERDVELLFATNYLGAVRVTRAFVPTMRRKGRGTVVNISSIAAHFPAACAAHYAASKAALETFSEGLAQEVASFGVRVALVVPGPVRTDIQEPAPVVPASDLYAAHHRRLSRRREVTGQRASDPIEVALCVEDAVDADSPRLRWVVGSEARRMWGARARTTDAQWVRAAALEDDESYYDEAARLFGVDLHR